MEAKQVDLEKQMVENRGMKTWRDDMAMKMREAMEKWMGASGVRLLVKLAKVGQ